MPFHLFLSFPLFFCLYWYGGRGRRWQNGLLLAGSYLFYAVWDWRFLPLLIGSSLLNYFLGIGIHKATNEAARRALLWIGLLEGVGSLVFFKYVHSFLPLGLSFYTFRTMSYLLDIKKNKIEPTHDWIAFFSYIAFFPCIIAGPIDRAGAFIPQLETPRIFDLPKASDNMRQILWGIFKKIAIADNCAVFTTDIFLHYKTLPGVSLWIGAFLYTIEIYADFSGYSDMAIGMAGLLGFRVAKNFNFPFFARNIADFWRRWHITLTSWLTDYVFTPLSIYFRDLGKIGLVLAILITFTLIGIWHGPKWTFVLFGFLHGCYYIPLLVSRWRPPLGRIGRMAGTFLLVMGTFILFRAESLSQAMGYYHRLFTAPFLTGFSIIQKVNFAATAVGIAILFTAEGLQRNKEHVLQIDCIKSRLVRTLIYYSLIGFILVFSPSEFADFIYIRF
ncbi:MAG TPA: MBOAT family O-acyltransferase [Puia sp.]|nr:MBOAT family O-acyltransferase [Puia sp.]